MYHLSKARIRERSAGQPLETNWPKLKAASVEFRRGQLIIIASGPGVGKSIFALTLAIWSRVNGIYQSADSGSSTQYARAVSVLTNELVAQVQAKMDRGSTAEYDAVLEQIHGLRFDFNAGPTLNDLEDAIYAFGHLHYRYPELLIVDNLSNVVDESGTEGFQGLENILAYLHELARKTNTCVVVLHHLTGFYEDGNTPPPLSALRGKVSKLPELILNLYREDDGFGGENLGIAIVKNRGGQANAAGNLTVSLALDLSRMSITDSSTDDIWGN
jgi:hypothetical protein